MITAEGGWLRDEYGRALLLRGANLGANAKLPTRPNAASHIREGFFDHRRVSFANPPFPLEEAGEHFARLKAWGFQLLRFLVTWEAVEHAGPGQYDRSYLDYLREVIRLAGEYGLQVYIDPHQDMWSRFTGGSGAPGWTLEAAGFDMAHFNETGAAIVHNLHGDPFPQMIWMTNYYKLAPATMFTLFFGGRAFAPRFTIDGVNAQDYLQEHYIAAFQQVARKLADLPNVIGYGVMNEPLRGYIGWQNLARHESRLHFGPSPTPYQSMLMAAGYPQWIDIMRVTPFGALSTARRLINPSRKCAWEACAADLWREAGVWGLDSRGLPRLLRPDHFARVDGRTASFGPDFYRPFVNRYARAIRAAHPGSLIFVHGEIGGEMPAWGPEDAADIVYDPHWYDSLLQVTKFYNPHLGFDLRKGGRLVLGRKRVQASFRDQVAALKDEGRQKLRGAPVLIGETGIPFDLNRQRAYQTGNYRNQIEALDRSLQAVEDNLVSYVLWNYNPDNNNTRGDHWNGEDYSIYSPDQRTDPADLNSGGRALAAVLRPSARAVAGEPLAQSFDLRTGSFEFRFRHDPGISAPTLFYIPAFHYPEGCRVEVSDGSFTHHPEDQELVYCHDPAHSEHRIVVRRP